MAEQKPFEKWNSLGGETGTPAFIPFTSENNEEYKFTREEQRNAEMILKQLDISFDPKSDEVKNLKLGKLDTAEDIKANRKIIGNMQMYANRSGNASIIKYVTSLNKYL